ncbi:MAG: HAD family hydrolase, partial [Anaerolineae bacterium]
MDDIRAIFFDLDGTLRRVKPTSQEALLAHADDLGYTVPNKGRRDAILWSHSYWADARGVQADLQQLGGRAFWEAYIQRFVEALKPQGAPLEETTAALAERFTASFRPSFSLMEGSKELLWTLRSEKFIVGLVSYRREPLTGDAIELGIIEHLNFTLAAGQVAMWKPDPGLFDAALDLAGCNPAEAVYVGVNYCADVVGAQRAGLTPVLID